MLRMQTHAHAAEAVLKKRTAEALQQAEAADRRADASAKAADDSAAVAEERRLHLAVLMDAIETLQAGTPGKQYANAVFEPTWLSWSHVQAILHGSQQHENAGGDPGQTICDLLRLFLKLKCEYTPKHDSCNLCMGAMSSLRWWLLWIRSCSLLHHSMPNIPQVCTCQNISNQQAGVHAAAQARRIRAF